MSDNGRISLIFACNLLLYFIIGQLNFLLGDWAIHIHLDALIVLFFGLYLSRISSLLFTSLLGFLADAMHPAPAGTYVVGYLCLWLFYVWCQGRIRRQNRIHLRSVAAIAQGIWLIALGLTLGSGQWSEGAYWNRIIYEMVLSVGLVFVFSSPWCKFQRKLLYSLGWDLEAQMTHL